MSVYRYDVVMTKLEYCVQDHGVGVLEDRFATLTPSQLLRHEQQSVIQLAMGVLKSRMATGELMTSPDKVKQYFQLKLGEEPNETFAVLFLTNRHMVISYEELFHGTIDGASVHPRVVAQRCLLLNASAVIFAHNHPSGIAEPSQADIQITQRLKEALALVDVRVLDHIVVGAGGIISLAERGDL